MPPSCVRSHDEGGGVRTYGGKSENDEQGVEELKSDWSAIVMSSDARPEGVVIDVGNTCSAAII